MNRGRPPLLLAASLPLPALAEAFLRAPGRRFVFLHISGLEYAGSRSGWLSEDYLDTLSSIDLALSRRSPSARTLPLPRAFLRC